MIEKIIKLFSWKAAYQHIQPQVTFHRSLGFKAREILWLPHDIISGVFVIVIWLLYTAILMPFGYLMLWWRFATENIERKKGKDL